MCRQTLNQHTCAHLTHGSLTTCAASSSPDHQRTSSTIPYATPCPSCQTGRPPSISLPPSYRPVASNMPSIPPPAYSTLPPTLTYTTAQQPVRQDLPVFYPQYPTYTCVHPPSTIQIPQRTLPQYQQLFFYPALPTVPTVITNYFPASFQTPPPFPPYPPGQVPSWYPHEKRYELIRGALTPVKHFAAPTNSNNTTISGRGWNPVHGYDSGPLPPGLGSCGETHLSRALSHVAVLTAGGNGGSENGGGSMNGDESARDVGSEVVEVGSAVEGSEARETTPQISFREPAATMGGESSGILCEERAREVGVAQGSSREADDEGVRGAAPIPPMEAPRTATASCGAETSHYECASGIGGRIARSEMERNLREVEGAGSLGRGRGSEERTAETSER